MGSAFIIKRETKSGVRWHVRYRQGGRGWPLRQAGSFAREKEARIRRDFVAGELAAGRDPALALAPREQPPRRTLADWSQRFVASRRDVAPATLANYETHAKAWGAALGDRDPHTLTVADLDEWVSGSGLAASSLRPYVVTLRQVLDFAGVEPNPARDKQLRLPRLAVEEISPPTGKQFLAILDHVSRRYVLPLVVLEQVGLRSGELASLAWGDVDLAENRFRLRAEATKSRRARWAQVPGWLMTEIADTCPLEDRTAERRVFPGFSRHAARNAVDRACLAAGIPHVHPHDLRHRRITLWHQQGVPAKQLADRVGHARASLTLDLYSHVMPLDEVPREQLLARIAP